MPLFECTARCQASNEGLMIGCFGESPPLHVPTLRRCSGERPCPSQTRFRRRRSKASLSSKALPFKFASGASADLTSHLAFTRHVRWSSGTKAEYSDLQAGLLALEQQRASKGLRGPRATHQQLLFLLICWRYA